MLNFQFHFDRISFLLGFLTAWLLWWLIGRIRPLVPRWHGQVRQFFNVLNQRNTAGVDEYMRKEIVQRAQRQHLAAALFSLDEILIPPALLIPPLEQDPTSQQEFHSVAGQTLPYLPDWPELLGNFSIPTFTLAHALQSGRHLVIIGHPGSGKTVALAHLADQIARRSPEVGSAANAALLYLHILDIDLHPSTDLTPNQNLLKAVSTNANRVMQPQIHRFLRGVLREKQARAILIIDGLDELPVEAFNAAAQFLSLLLQQYPQFQIITTASPVYFDGLTRAGFYPVAMAGWSQSQRDELTLKWDALWNTALSPELIKQGFNAEIDSTLIKNWLASENAYTTPLEWTLRLWGAYAGDLSGSSAPAALQALLERFLPAAACLPAMQALALDMLQKPAVSLSFSEMEKILSSVKISRLAPVEADAPEQEDTLTAQAPHQNREKYRQSIAVSQGEQIINALLDGAILAEHATGQIRFASPLFLGYLAGMELTDAEAETLLPVISWPAAASALQTAAACRSSAEWISSFIANTAPPLYQELFTAARWLRDAAPQAEWRTHVMRTLVEIIQDETQPIGTKGRCIAAFYLSRDPSAAKLYRSLLASRSVDIRQAALIGCGALANQALLNDIVSMLADPQPQIRRAACIALSAIPGDAALKALVDILLNGDENLRQTAAETLASGVHDGHKILEEASREDDLLTRRAAVYGLLQVRQSWARDILENIAIDDGQWVVRNAAAQALEAFQQQASAVPNALPIPSKSPWLITFASKLGMGILPGQPATEILLSVLKSGSVDEQMAALRYLREQPDDGIVMEIYHLLYGGPEDVREPALQALRWIAASGYNLPAPAQFGLG